MTEDGVDYAPTVYLRDGTPVKVRIIGADCVGDVSGESHYGYKKVSEEADRPTVYFEEVSEPNRREKDTEDSP